MARRAKTTPVVPDEQKLDTYKRQLASDADCVRDTRRAAHEDMRFVNVPGGMWEDGFESFANRVRLELDKCSDYVQRFIGEWNLNRVGVDFRPDDHKTSDDDAELLNGLYRADFRRSYGKLATDNMVDEIATCGTGAFMLATEFIDEEDPENDQQRVIWRPLYNAYNTVIWDKAAKRLDKSDARWCTVLKPYTKEEFEALYPDSSPVSAYDPDVLWRRSYRVADQMYVAVRYEVVKRRQQVFVYDNFAEERVEIFDREEHTRRRAELRSDPGRKFVRERRIVRTSVEKTVFSGDEILEPTVKIAGKHIPVVPGYGYRSYVDGIENYRGLVRKLKDACRLFNMITSQWAENSASAGNDIPIFDPAQMQNPDIQDAWRDLTNKPYLLAEALRDDAGNVIASGPLAYLKAPQLDGSTVALAGSVTEYIQNMTGGAPQDTLDPDASGKAIRALMKRENMSTQPVQDNISIAIARSGEIYQSIAAEIYNKPGPVRVLGLDGEESEKMLFETVNDNGRLQQINRLDGKKFHSYADTGPQYETLREESVENLKGLVQILSEVPGGQQFAPAAVTSLLQNVEGVGLEPLKKQVRQVMLAQGLVEPETDEDREFLMRAMQQQQQPTPQDQMIMAAVRQAMAEAMNLEASAMQKVADTEKTRAETSKTEAETVEIFADIDNQQINTALKGQQQLTDQRGRILESLQGLTVQ